MNKIGKLNIFGEVWYYLRVRKKWWLLPIITILILLGIILVFAQASVFAPMIYTIF